MQKSRTSVLPVFLKGDTFQLHFSFSWAKMDVEPGWKTKECNE
jgi:hypothetical protein